MIMNDILYEVSTVDSPDGGGLHVEPGLGRLEIEARGKHIAK